MINLLGPETKRNIRAARRNVRLRTFTVLSMLVTLSILAIYGVGFYLVMTDKSIAQQQLDHDRAAVSEYAGVLTRAKEYKTNLSIANKVLSTGMNYSTFMTSVAQALPPGSVLTQLTLIGLNETSTNAKTANTLILQARTTSYGSALQVKESLEASAIFENVSLADISKSEISTESTPLEKKYPFSLSINATISTQKTKATL